MTVDLARVDLHQAWKYYEKRVSVHRSLRRFFEGGDVPAYVGLALGIDDPTGNFSASDHKQHGPLGPKIRWSSRHAEQDVFDLAIAIEECGSPGQLLDLIYGPAIPYQKSALAARSLSC